MDISRKANKWSAGYVKRCSIPLIIGEIQINTTMRQCPTPVRMAIRKKKKGTSLEVQWLRIACQCRGHGFEPWSGKIPHAAEQLSPCATTTEAREPQLLKPACLEPMLPNKRSHHNEKPVHRNEEQPLLAATRESPHAAKKTQRSQK